VRVRESVRPAPCADVVVNDIAEEDESERVAERHSQKRNNAIALKGDLTDEEQA
jgi:hypothetical protein